MDLFLGVWDLTSQTAFKNLPNSKPAFSRSQLQLRYFCLSLVLSFFFQVFRAWQHISQ